MKPAEFERLWTVIEPLLPPEQPKPKGGRPRISDKNVLRGILFILETGTPWEKLPLAMGCGSGMTCWRRLREWQQAGVWDRLHRLLLRELNAAGAFEWDRFSVDSGTVPAPRGARKQAQIRQTKGKAGPNDTSP
jgi:transposase